MSTVFCNDFLKAQPNIKSMNVNKGGKFSKGSFIFTQTPKKFNKKSRHLNFEFWCTFTSLESVVVFL